MKLNIHSDLSPKWSIPKKTMALVRRRKGTQEVVPSC